MPVGTVHFQPDGGEITLCCITKLIFGMMAKKQFGNKLYDRYNAFLENIDFETYTSTQIR